MGENVISHRHVHVVVSFALVLFLVLLPGCPGSGGGGGDNGNNVAPPMHCLDGIDNDGDGQTDMDDVGCMNDRDGTEYVGTECDDGRDNDGDTFIDGDDPGCWGLQ